MLCRANAAIFMPHACRYYFHATAADELVCFMLFHAAISPLMLFAAICFDVRCRRLYDYLLLPMPFFAARHAVADDAAYVDADAAMPRQRVLRKYYDVAAACYAAADIS